MTGVDLRRVVLLFVAIISAVMVCYDGWSDIFAASFNPRSSGVGLMAFAAAAYIVWRWRASIQLNGWGSGGALLILLVASFTYLLGADRHISVVVQASSILFLLGALGCVTGKRTLWPLTLAAVALLFAIPMPGIVNELINVPLQLIDAKLVEFVGHAMGLPIDRAGTLLTINGVTVDIDRGCDGLRLVWPMLLATYTAVAISGNAKWIHFAICLLAVPAALILNFIRLAVVSGLYGYADPSTAAFIHDMLGWILVLGAGYIPLAYLGVVQGPASTARDDRQEYTSVTHEGTLRLTVPFGAGITAVLLSLFTAQADTPEFELDADETVRSHLGAAPYRVNQWIGQDVPVPKREQEILAADALVQRLYRNMKSDDELLLLVAYHRDGRQSEGHDAPRCYRTRGWEVISETRGHWNLDSGSIRGTTYEFSRGNSRMTVFEFFVPPLTKTPVSGTQPRLNNTRAILRIQFLLGGSHSRNDSVQPVLADFLSTLIPHPAA